jgi:predicted cupin superfamily sugar epimerase
LRFDEVWFFHAGSPVEMVLLDPVETLALGPETPQALAPGGRWVAARVLAPDGSPDPAWALVGCVVSPGFEYDDFEAGNRESLVAAHPDAAEFIRALT